jgi:hypothetical protein
LSTPEGKVSAKHGIAQISEMLTVDIFAKYAQDSAHRLQEHNMDLFWRFHKQPLTVVSKKDIGA